MGPSWLWSYGSWINNYPCNQCTSPCLWRGVLDATLCDKVCQWLVTGRGVSPSTLISSTNKTDPYDITEILMKVALNTINHQGNIVEQKYCTWIFSKVDRFVIFPCFLQEIPVNCYQQQFFLLGVKNSYVKTHLINSYINPWCVLFRVKLMHWQLKLTLAVTKIEDLDFKKL